MTDPNDRGTRRAPIELPDGALVCFTVDVAFEGFLSASQYRIRPPPPDRADAFSLSFADYGPRVGSWRLLELFERLKLKSGWLANGLAAQRYPRTLKAIADAGHEMIGHGWSNDGGDVASEDVEVERLEVARTLAAITAATGTTPVGWLSPGYAGSAARRVALSEAGVFYDCDDAGDDLPYAVAVNGRPHIIMPATSFGSNDLGNFLHGRMSPKEFLSMVKSQFDAIYEEARGGRPGWMELVLHAHVAGRLQAAQEVREIIAYILGHARVWVAMRRDFARWILDHPRYHQ
jgi:peptidoglycan/xylan/chitin deacetylase (PgdA/CDA1 family)